MNFKTTLSTLAIVLFIAGCGKQDIESAPEPVRGLKTLLIDHQENSSLRRYPSVLQPSESTELSFQVSGKLGENNLSVGQTVKAGEILLSLNKRDFILAVETSEATLQEAQANVRNIQLDLQRKETLRAEGVISQTEFDNARTSFLTAKAQLEGATSRLNTAKEELAKSDLLAPYDGVINSIDARSFNNVSPGTTVATLYNPRGFEAQFSVSYEIAGRLVIGKPVNVRLADNPKITLQGQVTELATSTTQVSSFPVVVTLQGTHPGLKVGMAVEVSMEISVTDGTGFTLPMSAILVEGSIEIGEDFDPFDPQEVTVFLFDPDTETVKKHRVSIGGIRDNEVIIVKGLEAGDRVAIAGVSFLREGQKVKLLADNS